MRNGQTQAVIVAQREKEKGCQRMYSKVMDAFVGLVEAEQDKRLYSVVVVVVVAVHMEKHRRGHAKPSSPRCISGQTPPL